MKKRGLVLLMAAVMGMSFAGCGTSDDNTSVTQEQKKKDTKENDSKGNESAGNDSKGNTSSDTQLLHHIYTQVNAIMATEEGYDAFDHASFTQGMTLGEFIRLDKSKSDAGEFSGELLRFLGSKPEEIVFTSAEYKGLTGADAQIWLDDVGRAIVVLVGNDAKLGDTENVMYLPSKDDYDKVTN